MKNRLTILELEFCSFQTKFLEGNMKNKLLVLACLVFSLNLWLNLSQCLQEPADKDDKNVDVEDTTEEILHPPYGRYSGEYLTFEILEDMLYI